MIRPFTCICLLLACASGLYLYQSKHRVQMIDQQIEKTVRATEDLREQTRVLHAEWTLQNDPQRLQALADQFLNLKTVTPGQFTSLAELDNRLPPVPAPEPPPTEPQQAPVSEAPQPAEPPPPAAPAPATLPPVRATPAVAVAAPPPKPPDHKPPPHPAIAETTPVRSPSVNTHPEPAPPHQVVAEQHRPLIATVARAPVATPVAASVPMLGSSLGMARSASVPPPRPMPVSASQWVTNGGGG